MSKAPLSTVRERRAARFQDMGMVTKRLENRQCAIVSPSPTKTFSDMIKKVTESRAKYDDIANGFLDKHLIVKQLDEVVSC